MSISRLARYLVLTSLPVSSLFFSLGGKVEECFGIPVLQPKSTIIGSFDASGSKEGLSTQLYHPLTKEKIWDSAEAGGSFEIAAPVKGSYRLCFKSMVGSTQTLSFDTRVTHEYDYDSHAVKVATKAQTEKVADLVTLLQRNLLDLRDQQHHTMTREEVHRRAAEATTDSVGWWTVIKVFVLIVASVLQVLYLRSFFDTKQIV